MEITKQIIIDRALERFENNSIGVRQAKDLLKILEIANENKELKDIFNIKELEIISMHYYLDGIWTTVAPAFWFMYDFWNKFCKDILEIEPDVDLVNERIVSESYFPHYNIPTETVQDILLNS